MESIRSSYVALCKSRIRLLIFGGRCPGGLLTCGPTCQCFTKPIRVPHEAEQRQKQHVVKLKKMREKRIQQRVKWWLLRPSNLTAGKVQLCDLTPHCSLLCRRHDWGASPGCSALYSGMARGPDSLMSHMSAKGTRRLMKASAPLLRRRSTWHDAQWIVTCTVYSTIVLLFRTIHRYKPD